MAVLPEATSVIVRVDPVEARYPGILAAQWVDGDERRLCKPAGWRFERPMYAPGVYVAHGEDDPRMQYLRTEGNVDVYRDTLTGETMYRGRVISRDVH